MCRTGGRRCPSHSDPVKVAAYNAQRRARYAANKKGFSVPNSKPSVFKKPLNDLMNEGTPDTVSESSDSAGKFVIPPTEEPTVTQAETTHLGEPVEPAADLTVNPIFSKEWAGKKGAQLYGSKNATREQKELNINVDEIEGTLVDAKYFAATTVQGTINYNNLNDQSYKEFGFDEINSTQTLGETRAKFSVSDMVDYSKAELENMSPAEKASLRFFTSNNYEWLNGVLYGHESPDPDQDNEKPYFNKDTVDDKYHHYTMSYGEKTSSKVNEITGMIDSAMTKGPKKQRIVYRGMNQHNKAIEDAGGMNQWFDDNVKLGQELKFDGYQSSTPDLNSATSYSGSNGVLYEILTPEGVNVASVSQFEHEKEVLLPRNARYMIVGVHRDVKVNPYDKANVIQLIAMNDKGQILAGSNADITEPAMETVSNLPKKGLFNKIGKMFN